VNTDGTLVLFVSVADANWRPRSGAEAGRHATRNVFDTLLEVIDSKTGQLLSVTRLDDFVVPVSGCLCGATFTEDTDGFIRTTILRFRK
jgi:hypothetical protein